MSTAFDASGNQTLGLDAQGLTRTFYDADNRVVAVYAPNSVPLSESLAPLAA